MNVLVDRHHAALLHSLQLLFEDRLAMNLYVPVGHDWWDEGFWRFGEVWGDDRLAQQFLSYSGWTPIDVLDYRFQSFDPDYPERPIRGVSLKGARQMEWDFVLATVPENQQGFHRFATATGAISCYQIGNTRQSCDWSLDQRVLVSSEVEIPAAAKAVRYRQEFDLTNVFRFQDPRGFTIFGRDGRGWGGRADRRSVGSFVNLLERMPAEWCRFSEAERLLSEFQFATHGHDSRNRFVQPQTKVASLMATYGFAWHDKPSGDGFGHVIHAWAAVGRPLVGSAACYAGQLAEPLWQDGVTCLDLGARSLEQTALELRAIASDPQRHLAMCLAIRERLEGLCDFAGDARRIAALLGLAPVAPLD